MITKFNIKNVATIENLEMEPNRVNFIFGANGTGKSTIANFLANRNNDSYIDYNNEESEILVYNKDFIKKILVILMQ